MVMTPIKAHQHLRVPYILYIEYLPTLRGLLLAPLLDINTLSKYFYFMRLTNSSSRRICGAEEETSAHILRECEALASLRHAYLGSISWTQSKLRV